MTPNSLPAVTACAVAGVPRLELDVRFLADDAMLILHDEILERSTTGAGRVRDLVRAEATSLRYLAGNGESGVCFLEEAVEVLAPEPTLLQVDLKLIRPITTAQADILSSTLAPLGDRVIIGSMAHWNLRALAERGLPIAFHPTLHIHYAPDRTGPGLTPFRMGVHGFWDDAPFASVPHASARQYLASRVDDLVALLPMASEWMVDIRTILRMAELDYPLGLELEARGIELAAWTLRDGGPDETLTSVRRLCAAGVSTFIADDAPAIARHMGMDR